MFNIEFISDPTSDPTIEDGDIETSARGRLTLGDFTETFIAPLDYWSIDDYKLHWLYAAEHLLVTRDKTIFFTTMYDPNYANVLVAWPTWCFGEQVRVRNQLLFLEEIKTQFDPQNPYSHIEDFVESCEDEPISTWTITLEDVAKFIRRQS